MTVSRMFLRSTLSHRRRIIHSLLFLVIVVITGACQQNAVQQSLVCSKTKAVTGSGSTFDYPLFAKMFSEYRKLPCGIHVTYRAVGSGTGMNDLLQGRVDFAASDSPLTDQQIATSSQGAVLHVPITLGIIAITYNIPGIASDRHIKLTGTLLAAIYLGEILFWDDPLLKEINPELELPHVPITVVHREDGSGTTDIFSQFLSAVSPTWKEKVGAGTIVPWPLGISGKGNAGTATVVKNTPGSISYNELTYVVANLLPYALIYNRAGKYLAPTLDGAQAATQRTVFPDDMRVSIVNSEDQDAYPISGLSWVQVYQHQPDSEKGKALAQLLWWMIHDGQHYATALIYASLPKSVVEKGEQQIKKMVCGRQHINCFAAASIA